MYHLAGPARTYFCVCVRKNTRDYIQKRKYKRNGEIGIEHEQFTVDAIIDSS